MQARTYGVITKDSKNKFINIFGHTSQGLPGIQFTGLGPYGRILREKIYFLIKINKIQIPLRKYSITIESKRYDDSFIDLELSIFVLFLQLAGVINIHNLEYCFSSGRIGVNGEFVSNKLDQRLLSFIKVNSSKQACYLNLGQLDDAFTSIPLNKLAPDIFKKM